MQHNEIDMVLVGSDRTSSNGDVCNKIGTYLKALSAFDDIFLSMLHYLHQLLIGILKTELKIFQLRKEMQVK